MRIGVDLDLFRILVKDGQEDERLVPLTLSQLAHKTQCESELLDRILRGLLAHGAVDKVRGGGYLPNRTTAAYARNDFSNGVRYL